MRNVLPLAEPLITSLPMHANATSIINGGVLNHDHPWLYNCFIQLSSLDKTYIDYYDFYYSNCPLLKCQKIDLKLLKKFGINGLDFVRMAIDCGYYIYMEGNVKCIPIYKTTYDSTHDFMIYGYDDACGAFYIADNFDNGKYSYSTCLYTDLGEAINLEYQREETFIDLGCCIELISYTERNWAKFELPRIMESLNDYINAAPTQRWYTAHEIWIEERDRNRCYGINCYGLVDHYTAMCRDTKSLYKYRICLRSFYLLMEHKKIMVRRLMYIKEHACIRGLNEIIEKYTKIERDARLALALLIKCDIENNVSGFVRIEELYKRIRDDEPELIVRLLRNYSAG